MTSPNELLRQSTAAFGHFEAEVQAVFLAGCKICGTKHPLAHNPPLPADKCPGCGAPAEPPSPPVVVPAAVPWGTSFKGSIARGLLSIGSFLSRLASTRF